MKVTAILKDFTEEFYSGHGESIKGLLNMSDAEKFEYLRSEKAGRVPMKIGSGQFRDAVELNQLRRLNPAITCTIEPRRGYKLATFTFTA